MPLHENHLPVPLINLIQLLDLPPANTWQEAKNVFSRYARKPGQERWELPPLSFPEQQTARIERALEELGFINAITPGNNSYDYAIVPGATVPAMITRFDYLIDQWQTGIRFKQLVFLTGQRPLSEQADDFQRQIIKWTGKASDISWNDKNLPMDESEAAQIIYAMGTLSETLRKVPVIFNSAPREWLANTHTWQRANTVMTIHSWLKQKKTTSGSILVVSNQPSALYQNEVFKNALPERFSLETIAPRCHKNILLPVILDAIWLWLKNKVSC